MSPAGVLVKPPAPVQLRITAGDPEVTVRFGSATYNVPEGGIRHVSVVLDEDPERTVVIPITKTNQGGARSGDYSVDPDPTNVTFNAGGDLTQTFTFTATPDTDDDDNESVLLGFGTMPDARVTAGTTSQSTVRITAADDPEVTVKFGAVTSGFSLLIYGGGSVDDLGACAQSRSVTALYVPHEGEYVSYILGAPDFVNEPFVALYRDGLPALAPLIAKSAGPPSQSGHGAVDHGVRVLLKIARQLSLEFLDPMIDLADLANHRADSRGERTAHHGRPPRARGARGRRGRALPTRRRCRLTRPRGAARTRLAVWRCLRGALRSATSHSRIVARCGPSRAPPRERSRSAPAPHASRSRPALRAPCHERRHRALHRGTLDAQTRCSTGTRGRRRCGRHRTGVFHV